MLRLEEYTWVFVGCGGTFYTVSPYLAVLMARYNKRLPILIDPDVVETRNYDRQWPGYGVGDSKVACAEEVLSLEASTLLLDRFQADDSVLEGETDGRPVLAIVNVDNDQCRLDVAEWLESRMSPGIMVVSGCEKTYGQCYPGIWETGEAIYDWRERHEDVGQDENRRPGRACSVQTVQANALTGVLVGLCLENIARCLEEGKWQEVKEFYWEVNSRGGLKLYDVSVCLKGESC